MAEFKAPQHLHKQAQLVDKLWHLTISNRLDWMTTEDEDAFQISWNDASIRIKELGFSNISYLISIFNSDGVVADSFTDGSLDQIGVRTSETGLTWDSVMRDIFTAAKRAALGSDKLLDKLLDRL